MVNSFFKLYKLLSGKNDIAQLAATQITTTEIQCQKWLDGQIIYLA